MADNCCKPQTDTGYAGPPDVSTPPHESGCCGQPAPPEQPSVPTPTEGCETMGCGTEKCPASGAGAADGIAQKQNEAVAEMTPEYPGSCPKSPNVNASGGALIYSIPTPASGPFGPQSSLHYSSLAANNTIEYGYGWSGLFSQTVEEMTGTIADVIKGDGSAFQYTGLSAGVYVTPPEARNSLSRTTSPAGWIERQPDGLELHYDDNSGVGKLVKLKQGSQSWTLTYSSDRLESIQDPTGRLTTYGYDGSDKIESITDSAGRITTFTVDAAGDLTEITTPELCVTQLGYDYSHRLKTYIDPAGNCSTYIYNASGRIKEIVSPLGDITTYIYDDTNVAITDALGRVTSLTIDLNGDFRGIIRPSGAITTWAYTSSRVTAKFDPRGYRTTFAYSSQLPDGRQPLKSIEYPSGARYTFIYDPSTSELKGSVDELGRYTTLTWQGGVRTEVIDALGYITTFTYTTASQVKSQTNPLGLTTTLHYDTQGRIEAWENPLGERYTYGYDAFNRRQTVKDPLGHVTTTNYDLVNRPTETVDPLGNRTTLTYTLTGKLYESINPLGQISTYLYDFDDRLEATVDPLGARTTYGYDAVGNLTKVTPPLYLLGQDAFNRSDSTNLGDNWLEIYGDWEIKSNKLHCIGELSNAVVLWATQPSTADYIVQARLNYTGAGTLGLHLVARYLDDGNYYIVRIRFGDTSDAADIGRFVDGSSTVLATYAPGIAVNSNPLVTFRVEGSQLTLLLDGVVALTATDSNLTAPGRGGCRMGGTGHPSTVTATWDDFQLFELTSSQSVYDDDDRLLASIDPCGRRMTYSYDASGNQIAVLSPATVFAADNFDRPNSTNLGSAWTEVSGAWQITNSRLALNNEVSGSVAIWNETPPTADYEVQAWVTSTATGGSPTLVARYVDANNNYRVKLTFDDATATALTIVKVVGGSTTTLAGTSFTASADVGYLLALRMEGSTLTALVDGRPLLTTTDTTFTAPGQAGCRMGAGGSSSVVTTTWSDFRILVSPASQTIYDSQNRPLASVDPLGNRTTYGYDKAGRRTTTENPLGYVTTVKYDELGRIEATIDPLGQRTTTLYDEAGRVKATENPLGFRNTTVYDDASRPKAQVNPLGERTTTTYDAAGRAIERKNPLGIVWTTVYDDANRPKASVDPLGNRTSTTYDNASRPTERINPLGEVNTTVYDETGRAKASVNPLGERDTTVYDEAGWPFASVSPLGYRATTVFDACGRMRQSIDPLGNVVAEQRYDALGRGAFSEVPAIPVAFDDFNRADSTNLGTNWTENSGNWQIKSNKLMMVTESAGSIATWNEPPSSPNYEVEAVVSADEGGLPGIVARFVDTSNYYLARMRYSTSWSIYQVSIAREVGGDFSTLATAWHGALPFRAHRLALRVIGTELTLLVDGEPVLVVHDATLAAAGKAGVRMGGTTHSPVSMSWNDFRVTLPAVTQSVYDFASRPTAQINPLGFVTTNVYDAASQPISSIDALGRRTTQAYDALGRPQASVDALGFRVTSLYDEASRPIARIDQLGYRTTTVFDNASRPKAMQNAIGNLWTTTYDPAGRAETQQTPLGFASTMVYDDAGRTIAAVNPLGFRTTTHYDPASRPKAVEDANGRRMTTIYDIGGRPQAAQSALNYRTTTIYDEAGRRIALLDANGGRNTFTLDADDRQIQLIDPLGRITTSIYDAAGRQTQRQDARGYVTTYSHSAADELLGRLYPDGTRVTLAYDALSSRVKMEDGVGRWTYAYDALGRKETVTNPASMTITSSYDARGLRSSTIAPQVGRFTYGYDATGQLESIVNPFAERTTYSYDAAGRRTLKRLSNQTRTSMTYDQADRLTQLYHLKSDNSIIESFDYDIDPVGNRTSQVESSGALTTWGYDATYQLTREQRGGATTFTWDQQFTYDPLGNRLVRNADGDLITSTYDLANQLLASTDAAGVTTYTFDANGSQQLVLEPSGARTTNAWDYENRTTRVDVPSGAIATYTFDGDNHRIEKNVDGTKTRFLWDGQNYLGELDGANAAKAVFTNEPGDYAPLVSQARWNGSVWIPSYYHFDAVGTARGLTDGTETVTDSYILDAWGTLLGSAGGTHNSFIFSGEYRYYNDPETQLTYVLARLFKSKAGNWISCDPLIKELSTADIGVLYVQSLLGRYKYARNSPLNYIDPSGYLECSCKGRCKKLQNFAPTLDAYITGAIYGAMLQSWLFGGDVSHILHDFLASESGDFASWGGGGVSFSIETTGIENWIHTQVGLGGAMPGIPMQQKVVTFTTADCIRIKCPNSDSCIGSDKIGHFFQGGYMGYELVQALGDKYGQAFFYWTEGLFTQLKRPIFDEQRKWLEDPNSQFQFRLFPDTSIANKKEMWGGKLRKGGRRIPVDLPRSEEDVAANAAGFEFWNKFVPAPFAQFHICDYVFMFGATWEE